MFQTIRVFGPYAYGADRLSILVWSDRMSILIRSSTSWTIRAYLKHVNDKGVSLKHAKTKVFSLSVSMTKVFTKAHQRQRCLLKACQ